MAFRPAVLINKTPTQLFSCEYCEILEHPPTAGPVSSCTYHCCISYEKHVTFFSLTYFKTIEPES